MLGVRGPNSRADAYGIIAAPPFGGSHLAIQINQSDREEGDGPCTTISFDEADIEGTFHSPGHPGVIGLWLAAFTVAGTITDPITVLSFDPTLYEVPDLAPAGNGYMFVRGFTWEPGVGRKAYP